MFVVDMFIRKNINKKSFNPDLLLSPLRAAGMDQLACHGHKHIIIVIFIDNSAERVIPFGSNCSRERALQCFYLG